MRKELLKGLTDEQIAKVEACSSVEEVLEIAKVEGVELNDEQLGAVTGGACQEPNDNPFDRRDNVLDIIEDSDTTNDVRKPNIIVANKTPMG